MDDTLEACARDLVAPPRGILAADEDETTIAGRFAAAGVTSDEGTRRRYRLMLLTTPDLSAHISGVILLEETGAHGLVVPARGGMTG